MSHADLDLDTASGMRSLERRLQAAAERVCGAADPRALRHRRHVNDCRDRAVNEAMADVAVPTMFVALR